MTLVAGCATAEPPPAAPTTTTSTTKPTTTAEAKLLPVPLTGPRPTILSYDQMRRMVPDAPESAPLRVRAEQTLRQETLFMANVAGKVTAHCTEDLSDCRSTYNGITIPWGVGSDTRIEPRGPFPGTKEYTFYPLKAVVTSVSAYHDIWPDGPESSVRCDRLPKAFLVETGTSMDGADSGYRCQILQVPDENNVRRWREFGLFVEEDGSIFWR